MVLCSLTGPEPGLLAPVVPGAGGDTDTVTSRHPLLGPRQLLLAG